MKLYPLLFCLFALSLAPFALGLVSQIPLVEISDEDFTKLQSLYQRNSLRSGNIHDSSDRPLCIYQSDKHDTSSSGDKDEKEKDGEEKEGFGKRGRKFLARLWNRSWNRQARTPFGSNGFFKAFRSNKMVNPNENNNMKLSEISTIGKQNSPVPSSDVICLYRSVRDDAVGVAPVNDEPGNFGALPQFGGYHQNEREEDEDEETSGNLGYYNGYQGFSEQGYQHQGFSGQGYQQQYYGQDNDDDDDEDEEGGSNDDDEKGEDEDDDDGNYASNYNYYGAALGSQPYGQYYNQQPYGGYYNNDDDDDDDEEDGEDGDDGEDDDDDEDEEGRNSKKKPKKVVKKISKSPNKGSFFNF